MIPLFIIRQTRHATFHSLRLFHSGNLYNCGAGAHHWRTGAVHPMFHTLMSYRRIVGYMQYSKGVAFDRLSPVFGQSRILHGLVSTQTRRGLSTSGHEQRISLAWNISDGFWIMQGDLQFLENSRQRIGMENRNQITCAQHLLDPVKRPLVRDNVRIDCPDDQFAGGHSPTWNRA
jgi:hypothetical protein